MIRLQVERLILLQMDPIENHMVVIVLETEDLQDQLQDSISMLMMFSNVEINQEIVLIRYESYLFRYFKLKFFIS